MTEELRASPLVAEALPAMRAALRAASLPADDLDEPSLTLFAYERFGRVVGYGGFEVHGDVALLRSIVVRPDHRSEGIGRRIVELLIASAGGLGVERAYLLTTDARDYFEGLGFEVVDRRDAPAALMQTRQMAGLCPASAVLMAKALTP